MQKKTAFIYSCLFFFLFIVLFPAAQEQEGILQEKINPRTTQPKEQTAQMVPRSILLYFEPLHSLSLRQADLLLVYDSLIIKLNQELTGAHIIELPAHHTIPTASSGKTALATSMAADAWLWIRLSGTDTALVIEMISWDGITTREAFNFKEIKANLYGLERHFWKELVVKMNDSYQQKIAQAKPDTDRPVPQIGPCRLLLKAQPHSIISGLDESPQTIDETGELAVELQKYHTYIIQATNKDYIQLNKTIYLTRDNQEISLTQKHKVHWTTSLYLYNFSYTGLEITYYPIPGFFFFRSSLTIFSVSMPNWQEKDSTGFPVADINIICGMDLFPASSIVCGYLALGNMIRIMKQQEPLLPGTDSNAVFYGFSPVAGLAIMTPARFQLYGEYCPVCFLNPSLKLKHLIYDLLCFNLGIRLQF